MVNGAGQVVATVFAAITGGGPPGGFAIPDSIVRQELARVRSQAVSTGACG